MSCVIVSDSPLFELEKEKEGKYYQEFESKHEAQIYLLDVCDRVEGDSIITKIGALIETSGATIFTGKEAKEYLKEL